MSGDSSPGEEERSLDGIRAGLVARLRGRRAELEEMIVARVLAVSGPMEDKDAEYVTGLRAAVAAAVDLSFTDIEKGQEWSGPLPQAIAVQARRAARYGVSLDTVLRRYATGDRLIGDFVMDESDHFPRQALRRVVRSQGTLVGRLMGAIATEYTQEVDQARHSPELRRAERVQALLLGTAEGSSGLNYDLEARHIGVIANGEQATAVLESLSEGLGCQLLSIPRWDGSLWAWLGGGSTLAVEDLERRVDGRRVAGVSLALGEVASGVDGWRMTHWQAQRALWVALRSPNMLTRYAEVMLLAPVVRDDVLARSLREIYLVPLANQRDGGAVSRETLRTYFAVGRNAATAAAVLKVDRHTVKRRLHKIEESLGRSLDACQAELEVALRLEALDAGGPAGDLDGRPPLG